MLKELGSGDVDSGTAGLPPVTPVDVSWKNIDFKIPLGGKDKVGGDGSTTDSQTLKGPSQLRAEDGRQGAAGVEWQVSVIDDKRALPVTHTACDVLEMPRDRHRGAPRQ